MQKLPGMILRELLQRTTGQFQSHSIEEPIADAEILIAHALGLRRIDLYIRSGQLVNGEELSAISALINRRLKREPVSYIIGSREFWCLPLKVDLNVLIPRPDTECLIESALQVLAEFPPDGMRILDLGTGSGAIVLALASEYPGHMFFASDISVNALRIAKENAVTHRLERHIHFLGGKWFAPFNQRMHFDMIVSNPPYISHQAIQSLPPEIVQYEPIEALNGGTDGLEAIRIIIQNAHYYLKPNGMLLIETGYDQWDRINEFIQGIACYRDIRRIKDYAGNDRVVTLSI